MNSAKSLWQALNSVVGIATLVVGLLTLGVAAFTLHFAMQSWRVDKVDEWHRSQPRLEVIEESSRVENGYTVLTLENKSPVTPAAITEIRFYITDPIMLDRIRRRDPQADSPIAMKLNPVDNALFVDGEWWGNDRYMFSISPNNHIKPSSVNDMRLTIVNPKWAGYRFRGSLVILYESPNSPLKLEDVPIQGRSRK